MVLGMDRRGSVGDGVQRVGLNERRDANWWRSTDYTLGKRPIGFTDGPTTSITRSGDTNSWLTRPSHRYKLSFFPALTSTPSVTARWGTRGFAGTFAAYGSLRSASACGSSGSCWFGSETVSYACTRIW